MTTISSKSFDLGGEAFVGGPTSEPAVRLQERHIQSPKPKLRAGAVTLDDFISEELKRDAGLEQRLQEATRNLGSILAPNDERSLRSLRFSKGWTQADLAMRMATSQAMVSKWESGYGDMQLSTVRALARVFGMTVGDLDACLPAYGEGQSAITVVNV